MLPVDDLPRPVVIVRHERQGDGAGQRTPERGAAGAQPGPVGLGNRPARELGLERGLAGEIAGEHHDSGSVHVEAVAGMDLAVLLREQVKQRFHAGPSRHRKHPGRLVHHYDIPVGVQDFRFRTLVFAVERVRLHLQPFGHESQQRAAFAEAGGVETAVLPDFGAVRRAVPEFPHGQGLHAVEVGVLQEFGRGAFAGAARGNHAPAREDLLYRKALSAGVQNPVLLEQPVLEPGGRMTLGDTVGHRRDFSFAKPEISGRVAVVEYGRHEAVQHRMPSGKSAECLEAAAVGEQHAEHLPFGENAPQRGGGVDSRRERPGGLHYARCGRIAEGTGEHLATGTS